MGPPGLNDRQTGTVPKNKPKMTQSPRVQRDYSLCTNSLDWETGPSNQNLYTPHRTRGRPSGSESGHELNRSKNNMATVTHQDHMVDNDNGEVSWSGNEREGEINGHSGSSSRKSSVAIVRQQNSWNGPSSSNQSEVMQTDNIPDHAQVANKLLRIQGYIKETTSLMNSLKGQDSVKSNDSESLKEEDLRKKSEESRRRVEVLQKRKEELVMMQERAKQQLVDAQEERERLLARVGELNVLTNSTGIDNNMQTISQRLRNLQQIYTNQNEVSHLMNEGLNVMNHHDEDRDELSDNECDLQAVKDKMTELNAMKAQLSQLQNVMSRLNQQVRVHTGNEHQHQSREDDIVPLPVNKQNVSSPNSVQLEQSSFDTDRAAIELRNKTVKLEEAKVKLAQLTEMLQIVQNVQNSTGEGLSAEYLEMIRNVTDEDDESVLSSPSNSHQQQEQERDMRTVVKIEAMTRELEEKTQTMREEHDRLVETRKELHNITNRLKNKKKDGITQEELNQISSLISNNIDSSYRDDLNVTTSTEPQASPSSKQNENSVNSPYICRTSSPRSRERAVWNSQPQQMPQTQTSVPKNADRSRNSSQSGAVNGRNIREASQAQSILSDVQEPWQDTASSLNSNINLNNVMQVQNQLEMTSNLCNRILESSEPRNTTTADMNLTGINAILFTQQQMLAKTVAQCAQLLYIQQRQIYQMRNTMMVNQSVIQNQQMLQNLIGSLQSNIDHSQRINQPQNDFVQVTPTLQEQPLGQDLSRFCNPLNTQNPNDFRFGPMNLLQTSSALNNQIPNVQLNMNNQLGQATGVLNNQVPAGLNCLAPDTLGPSCTLNNQVPPGNRANNYWDNFRSYSRQNLLSNSKSNEDTQSRRTFVIREERPPGNYGRGIQERAVSAGAQNNQLNTCNNQERIASIGSQNNQLNVPVHTIGPQNNQSNLPNYTLGSQPLLSHENEGFNYSLLVTNQRRQAHSQITRSRSVDPQNLRTSLKNESTGRNDERRSAVETSSLRNDDGVRYVKNEAPEGRNTEGSGSLRHEEITRYGKNEAPERRVQSLGEASGSSRNDDSSRYSLGRDRGAESQGNNKKKIDKSRSRNEARENLNNRSDINSGLFSLLRDNVYLEVTNFIRSNETRPHFLIQLFRDLQQINTDTLRQRTLQSIHENINSSNRNINRCNLHRNVEETPHESLNVFENRTNNLDTNVRIDELFYQLRENQNTIRQNISNTDSNIRNDGLRDLQSYYQANLCDFGNNALENPNLSNIRENLTVEGYQNMNPKNLYTNVYDNLVVEMRRRNLLGERIGSEHLMQRDEFQVNQNFELVGRDSNSSENHGIGKIDSNYKTDHSEEEEGAVGLPLDWGQNNLLNESYISSINIMPAGVPSFTNDNTSNNSVSKTSSKNKFPQETDNGDLAEADQSRLEENPFNIQEKESENLFGTIENRVVERENNFIPLQNRVAEANILQNHTTEAESNFASSQSVSESEGFAVVRSSELKNIFGISESDRFLVDENIAPESEIYFPEQNRRGKRTGAKTSQHFEVGECTQKDNLAKNLMKRKSDERTLFLNSEEEKGLAEAIDDREKDLAEGHLEYTGIPSLVDISDEDDEPETDLVSGRNTSPEAEIGWEIENGLDQVPSRLQRNEESPSKTT